MQLIRYPGRSEWAALISRPQLDRQIIEKSVRRVLKQVARNGDPAVRRFTRQFDHVSLRDLELHASDIVNAEQAIDPRLAEAIRLAATNIRVFHSSQLKPEDEVEVLPGVRCWRRSLPIQRVGLYVPGGSAPLFSTILMLGIPAVLAGCRELVLCSPPDPRGQLHPAIVFAARLVGVHRIFRVGGVQAIAAMAYGTETIPKVDKIFGPGNQYVTMAKLLVQQEGVAIDMPAGPSELCVLADHTGHPEFIAADLLSQAEHGPDSQVMLISTDESLLAAVQNQLHIQLKELPRADTALEALSHSRAILVHDLNEGMALANAYAPEHLILACSEAEDVAGGVESAGSVFLGHYAPESAGDYASGTNHTLPTNGHARAYSGVSVDSFVRKVTFQSISPAGLEALASTIMTMAEAEGLQGHATAVGMRMGVPK